MTTAQERLQENASKNSPNVAAESDERKTLETITTTQREMNARANSLAESLRQARERRAHRIAHPDEEGVQPAVRFRNAQKVARPAGIEPAAPRLGGGCSIR